jgi:hypothetical protein
MFIYLFTSQVNHRHFVDAIVALSLAPPFVTRRHHLYSPVLMRQSTQILPPIMLTTEISSMNSFLRAMCRHFSHPAIPFHPLYSPVSTHESTLTWPPITLTTEISSVFSFLLSLSLPLSETLTPSNVRSFTRDLLRFPAFVLFTNRKCPPCRDAIHLWKSLADHYATDPSVYIASIDCASYPNECEDLALVSDYPGFVGFTKSRWRIVRPQRTIDGLISEVEALKRVNFSVPCLEFPIEFDGRYPYFVYESETNNATALCARLDQMNRWFSELTTHFYYRPYSTKTRLTAVVNERMSFNHTGDFDIRGMVLFVKDYIMMPLGAWRIDDGLLTKRRFVFFVHNSSVDHFLDEAVEHIPEFLVGQLKYKDFQALYPKVKIVSPALIASNVEKTRFVVINGVDSVERFREVLKEIAALKWEEKMVLELPKLFPRLAKEDEPEQGKGIEWGTVGATIGIVGLLIGVSLCRRKKPREVKAKEKEKEKRE